MAECVASAFCVKLDMQRRFVRERGFSGQILNLKPVQRKYTRSGCKFVNLSTWKAVELSVFGATNFKSTPRLQEPALKCIGLGALVDFNGSTASDLVPVFDQVLLMGSIFLTYMAGVIPVEKSYASYQKTNSDKNVFPELSDISGSSAKQNYGVESKYVLNVVRGKLLNSLNALEQKAYSGDIILQSAKRPLSLSAVARGPKLRLIWASFQQVEQEVNNISNISRAVGLDDVFGMFSEIIQRSCCSICASWLEKEFLLLKGNADQDLNSKLEKMPEESTRFEWTMEQFLSFRFCSTQPFKDSIFLQKRKQELASMILEKVREDNTIVQSITRSGKKDLYSELFWYLTFGSLREDCCYDSRIFAVHGISILEDLVIALADGVASVYLEFISVDSDVSSKTNSLDMSLCALSTRELQKLRNEVALNQWLYHNMDTVVSMYEDRFDLCILESQPIDLTDNVQTEKENWWKRFTQQNAKTMSSELHCIEISHFSMPVKRTKELRALTGWRYYFSLFLELSDITMPLVRAVIDKVSDAISFFLVSLIGRSLGLIYTGIRQSLRWK